MISIIICSAKKHLRDAIILNIKETIGVEHEVIIIENEIQKVSISKAYNISASKAKFSYLCFIHEDIIFHTKFWGEILIKTFLETQARLIGFMGSTIKTRYPSGVHIAGSDYNRQYHLQRWPDGLVTESKINPKQEFYSEVCVLDGLFIASTKKAWEETKFSEEYLKDFHGYDIDFSLKNFFLGKNYVIYNIVLEHLSLGSFNKKWVETQFMLSDMWKDRLPARVATLTEKDITSINRRAVEQLLILLISLHYNFLTEVKYYIIQLYFSPFGKWNARLFARLFLRKKASQALRSLLKSAKYRYAN